MFCIFCHLPLAEDEILILFMLDSLWIFCVPQVTTERLREVLLLIKSYFWYLWKQRKNGLYIEVKTFLQIGVRRSCDRRLKKEDLLHHRPTSSELFNNVLKSQASFLKKVLKILWQRRNFIILGSKTWQTLSSLQHLKEYVSHGKLVLNTILIFASKNACVHNRDTFREYLFQNNS